MNLSNHRYDKFLPISPWKPVFGWIWNWQLFFKKAVSSISDFQLVSVSQWSPTTLGKFTQVWYCIDNPDLFMTRFFILTHLKKIVLKKSDNRRVEAILCTVRRLIRGLLLKIWISIKKLNYSLIGRLLSRCRKSIWCRYFKKDKMQRDQVLIIIASQLKEPMIFCAVHKITSNGMF